MALFWLIAAFWTQIFSSETVSIYITSVSISHPQSQIFSSFQGSSFMKSRNCTLKRVVYCVWVHMLCKALFSPCLWERISYNKSPLQKAKHETGCAHVCPLWLIELNYSNSYGASAFYFLLPDLLLNQEVVFLFNCCAKCNTAIFRQFGLVWFFPKFTFGFPASVYTQREV